MKRSLVLAFGLAALSAFAGWNGTGVPGGTGDNRVNLAANWTGEVIDGNFSGITVEGTNALVLTDDIAFAEGASMVMGAFFASNSTDIVFTSAVGVAVGQTVAGAGIPYNTFLIALADTNGTLGRVTTGASSGNYTLARPALNFNFGVTGTRATNVTVTLGSDVPGAARTLALTGRLCLSQYTLPANRLVLSPDIAVSAGNPTSVTRESGLTNTGGVIPAATFNGPLALGNYDVATTCFTLDGGDLALNGVVAGTNARINICGSAYAGTLTLTNSNNSFSGGLTTLGGGSLVANASTAFAVTGSNSALGSGGQFGLNNARYTLTGFTARQVCDRPWNIGGGTGSAIVNNGAAPVELTGLMRNEVSTYVVQLGGSYQNRSVPNVIGGYMYNGNTPNVLGVNVQNGTWRLTNPTNAFTGSVRVGTSNGATLQFASLENAGVKSPLGAGSQLYFESTGGNSAYMEYIGTNQVQCNREIRLSGNSSDGGSSVVQVNGLGRLELAGSIINSLTANSGGVGTRSLFLGGTGAGALSGAASLGDVISGSNTGRVAIYKVGSGTWTISGSNFNHRGATASRAGTLALDYSANDQIAAAAPGTVFLQGGTLRFVGKPVGVTADALGTLQLGDSVAQYRCSRLVLDANGGDGFALTVDKLEGEAKTQKLDLIDLSGSANNSVTVNSLGSSMPAVNGVVMNNSVGSTASRASLILKTASGLGFPALSGTTSGTLQLLGGLMPLPASGYANTVNYELTAGTVTPSSAVLFCTLTVDSSAGAVNLNLGANALYAGAYGKGILIKGANSVTFAGTGAGAHISSAFWFHNFLADGAAFTFNGNLGTGQITMWGNGGGLSIYNGIGFGNGLILGRGILRVNAAQTFGSTGRTSISDEGVFEIGADLNGAAAGDLSCALGTSPGTMTLYFNSGLSAAGTDRAVNFGGLGAPLTWGAAGFMVFPDNDTSGSDGGFAFKLSSPKADATIDIQNPINLNGNTVYGRIRTVDVADGGAAVDARLSGAISGNAAFAKKGAGTLELTGAQTYDGPLMVMEGKLCFGAGSSVANALVVQLRGGGLAAGGGGANSFGPLEVYADATLDLGDGSAPLVFADSSGAAWGGTLTLTGSLGLATLRIGTDASGLTAAQLAAIRIGGDKVGIGDDGFLRRVPAGTVISVR